MDWFNHNLTKKYIVIFGMLFDNITIDKFVSEDKRNNKNDIENTDIIKEINVPISYSNKNKLILNYLRRGNDPNNIRDLIETTVPRIGYQFTNIRYDRSRKINRLHFLQSPTSVNTTINRQYAPVPYNIDVEMSILVKKTIDGTKIVEQILPMFSPQIHVTSNLIPENDIKLDIPIVLNSVHLEEDYEKDYTERRIINWGMNFTIKGYYFGKINTEKIITDIKINANSTNLLEIKPDPESALYTDDFGFNTY